MKKKKNNWKKVELTQLEFFILLFIGVFSGAILGILFAGGYI